MNRQQRRVQSKKMRNSGGASLHALLQASVQFLNAERYRDAERVLMDILRASPEQPDALHVLGILANTEKRFADAVDFITRAITAFATEPPFFVNLGHAYAGLNQHAEAMAAFEMALEMQPDLPEARVGRVRAAKALGLMDRILSTQDEALLDDPTNLEALASYGDTLINMQQFDDALAVFDRLLTLAPPNVSVLSGRGAAFLGKYRYDAALVCLDLALSFDPDNANALNNRGVALNGLRRFVDSEQTLRKAQGLVPKSPEIAMNLASTLRGLGQVEAALRLYQEAIALKPDFRDAYGNLANTLSELRRFDEAKAVFAEISKRWPDYAEARWSEAVLDLLLGNLEEGFLKAEWRWECPVLGLTKQEFPKPLWLGEESLADKVILVYSDQGLGDALQFCRYIPLLAAMGARVIVQVQASMLDLVSSMEGVWFCTSDLQVPEYDYQCSLSTLPLAFKTNLKTIPANVPYLKAPADGIARDFGLSKDRLKVGLIWSGNPKHANDHNRSIPLTKLEPLFDLPVQFVSVMNDVRKSDQPTLAARSEVLDLATSLKTFSDTAALISELDLVISVDTSVAHLAGALGAPVWVLLPHVFDWRWLLDREDSPWYPTARLFRQTESGDWDGVIARVRAALRELESARQPR